MLLGEVDPQGMVVCAGVICVHHEVDTMGQWQKITLIASSAQFAGCASTQIVVVVLGACVDQPAVDVQRTTAWGDRSRAWHTWLGPAAELVGRSAACD